MKVEIVHVKGTDEVECERYDVQDGVLTCYERLHTPELTFTAYAPGFWLRVQPLATKQ